MSETRTFSHDAGDQFDSAANFGFEDAMQRRLRYHLLRLTVVGLTQLDVQELGELARLVFEGSDASQQATIISQRVDASPLASAIAQIMQKAAAGLDGPVRMPVVMLGALLGAYTALHHAGEPSQSDAAVAAAVGGAVAATVSGLVLDMIDQVGAAEYVRMDD
jgi:H+/Cl- antiporter ClcA